MDTISIEKDIILLCVQAETFPDGIMDAYQKLHSVVQPGADRRSFGISRMEDGAIVYKAAVEENREGEAEEFGLEKVVIKGGSYISETIHDYMNNLPAIGTTFQTLITQPGIDPSGYCVEAYTSQSEVQCMVRLH